MNGYINLELGGKSRGIKFGNRALLSLMSKYDFKTLAFSFDLIADLIYFGLLNNCLVKKEDPDFTIDDVLVWADDIGLEGLTTVFDVFQSSYNLGETKKTKGKK